MHFDVRTRATAAFAALTLASLLTTSAAIAATGAGLSVRPHVATCATGACVALSAIFQARPAHIAKVNAAIAMRGKRY